jgi:hypothetical protein
MWGFDPLDLARGVTGPAARAADSLFSYPHAMTVEHPGRAVSAPSGFLRRQRVKLVILGVLVGLGALFALYTFAMLKFSYSSGERVGYVQKLSRRGWICRTWEGELAMTPVPGASPQIFAFTVRDAAMAQQLSQSEGKRVTLQYQQKVGLPSRCFGDTEYFIVGVRTVGN